MLVTTVRGVIDSGIFCAVWHSLRARLDRGLGRLSAFASLSDQSNEC